MATLPLVSVGRRVRDGHGEAGAMRSERVNAGVALTSDGTCIASGYRKGEQCGDCLMFLERIDDAEHEATNDICGQVVEQGTRL